MEFETVIEKLSFHHRHPSRLESLRILQVVRIPCPPLMGHSFSDTNLPLAFWHSVSIGPLGRRKGDVILQFAAPVPERKQLEFIVLSTDVSQDWIVEPFVGFRILGRVAA